MDVPFPDARMSDMPSNASVLQMQGARSGGSGSASPSAGATWRRGVALFGIAALLVETLAALVQAPRAEPLRTPSTGSLDWWRYPIERNAIQRMPVSRGPLYAVHAQRGTDEVWFAGAGGLIVHSRDGGRTWDSTNVRAIPQRVAPAAYAAPEPAPDVTQSAPPSTSDQPAAAKAPALPNVRPAPRRPANSPSKTSLTPRRVFLATYVQEKSPYQQSGPTQQSPVQQVPLDRRGLPNARPVQPILPDVNGLQAGPAEKAMYSAGFKPRVVFTPVPDSARDGIVITTSRSAGQPAPMGAEVVLFVGRRRSSAGTSDSAATRAANGADSAGFYPRLAGICVTTSGHGWAVGEGGTAFRTADGGTTWSQLTTGTTGDLAEVACSPTLGAVAAGAAGVLWLPRDSASGATMRGAAPGALRHLVIGSADTIWASGNGSPMRYSADTGRTWIPVADARRSVAFADATTWFSVDSTGVVNVSSDAGRTWTRRPQCVANAASRTIDDHVVVAASRRSALVLNVDGHLLRTDDAWSSCARVADFDGDGRTRVAPASDDVWYAVSGSAYRSVDGGRTWHSVINEYRQTCLQFSDSLHGVAALADGGVAVTADGGRSWSLQRLADEAVGAKWVSPLGRTGLLVLVDTTLAFATTDGRAWERRALQGHVVPLLFEDDRNGIGYDGDSLVATSDGGRSWRRAAPTGALAGLARLTSMPAPTRLAERDVSPLSVGFLRDDRGGVAQLWMTESYRLLRYANARWDTLATGLIAASPVSPTLAYGLDSIGNLVRSTDGGRAWSAVPAAPPRKYPAPWYYALAVATVAGTLATARARRPSEQDAEESIADILVSDRPLREGDRDVLDFGRIAAGLSRFIRNTRTEPPLTIAVTGPWGTGKSSLMNLLRRDLQRRGFRTIWFNAWHHQREESLLASLLEVVRRTATPPVYSPRGLRFRGRLLARRLHRYRVTLLVLLPLSALAIGYLVSTRHLRHDIGSVIDAVLRTSASDKPDTNTTEHRATLVALVVSIVGTLFTYLKGLKAFGVKPGEVARSLVSAGRVRTIESQPAFRYRFAQDFSEVTEALKPERIVIFVDDLDRCKPEQVLEILEAINFLAESGDCVIVLGIDRERVTGCVAIGFKDVATVLAQASTTGTPVAKPDIGAAAPPAKTNLDYQIEYARHYLEKLLNMEIPIPPATAEGLGEVMTSSGEPVVESETESVETMEELRDRARRRWRSRLYTGALLAATAASFAWGITRGLERREAVAVAGAPLAVAPASAAGDTAVRERAAPATRDSGARAIADSARREPMVLVAGADPATAWWVHVPLALAAMGLLLWLLTPREDNRVEDSAAFATALKAWAPVLFEEHPTPRSAKKFLNKMRFLSMAQRAPGPRRAPVETIFDRLRGLPLVGRVFGRTAKEEPADALLPDAIPEVTLVSLNVIRDRYPEWLADPAFWSCDLQEYVKTRVDPVPMDVAEALRSLGEIQTRLNMGSHRDAWRRLELWVRDS